MTILDHFRIETHGDLLSPHFNNPRMVDGKDHSGLQRSPRLNAGILCTGKTGLAMERVALDLRHSKAYI